MLSILLGIIPMLLFAFLVYWLDHYEKEPKLLLGGVFAWGAIVAAGGAFLINTLLGTGIYLFTGSETATNLSTSAVIAPIIEESLKGFAVIIVFLFFRREFDSILDGIIYASVAALGFAATENIYYLFNYGYLEDGLGGLLVLAFIRIILVGWQHPFYTAFIGIGLALARLNRNPVIKVIAPVAGWGLAVLTHGLHNTLASLLTGGGGFLLGSVVDWTGWAMMFGFILWNISREQRYLSLQLREEVTLGNLTLNQYRIACSAWAQSAARISSLFRGRYQQTSRFYQLCGELAHKKHQREKLGEEGGNTALILRLREELFVLSPVVIN